LDLTVKIVIKNTGYMSHGVYTLRSRLLWWLW